MAVFLVRDPRCVFIHIPKTGGASIRHGFFNGNVEGPKQGFVPEDWQSLFAFTFVRNPYDRVISAWQMFASGMEQTVWQQPDDERDLSFNRFLEIATDDSIPFSGNRDTTAEKIRHHALPQTHEFNCLKFADFVGKFETLESDFQLVCERLNIACDQFPHWNRTRRNQNFMRYFDPTTRAIVEQFYAEDFQQLGYDMVQS